MAVCLAAIACFLASAALLALTCFCVDFFWFAFGDLSPMILFWFLRLNSPAACLFPRQPAHHPSSSRQSQGIARLMSDAENGVFTPYTVWQPADDLSGR
jgi:hypothetical protein